MTPATRSIVLLLSLAVSSPAAELAVSPGPGLADWVDRRDGFAFSLDRTSAPTDGLLAVTVGSTDVSALMTLEDGALVYRSDAPPLPAGEHEVVVWRVGADGGWTELLRTTLRVRTRAGWESSTVSPTVDLSVLAQVAEGHRPESNAPARRTFQDLNLQTGITSEHRRGGFALRTSATAVGVSEIEQALRFGEQGEHAPRFDLSSYLVEAGTGPLTISVGRIAFGSQRHLVSTFSSRGVVAALDLGAAVSLEVAAANGSSIVGWSNLLGLSSSDHRVLAATLCVEVLPSRPGGVRLELGALDGSVQPLTGFNQGAVVSAERSRGLGLRLAASDPDGRLQLDSGWARTRFEAAEDAELEQGLDVVPIAAATRDARYLEASWAFVRGVRLTETAGLDLTLAVHHERVEPLYRSVAAYTSADVEANSADLNGTIGPAAVQLSHGSSRDNLENIPSVLTTHTRRTAANLSLPVAALLSAGALVPNLSATWDRTHQVGTGIPVDGGFDASHVPDQIGVNRTAGLDWSGTGWTGGLAWGHSSQDNRQPGRENADFDTWTSGARFGFAAGPRLDIGLDVSLERSLSVESGRTDRTRRLGATVSWRPFDPLGVSGSLSWTRSLDDQGQSRSEGFDSDLQATWRLSLARVGLPSGSASLFARTTNREYSARDLVFGFDDDRRLWTVTVGLNVSFF